MSDEEAPSLPEGRKEETSESPAPNPGEGKQNPPKKKSWLRRHAWDMGLLAVLALGTAASFAVRGAMKGKKDEQLLATIRVAGKETARYELWKYDKDESKAKLETVEGTKNELTLELMYNAIRVKEAHCPNQTCVHQGWVKEANHPIICAYNQVVISIEGGDESTVVIG